MRGSGDVRPPTDGAARVLLAVEGSAATSDSLRLLLDDLRGRGHEVVDQPLARALGRPPAARLVLVVHVAAVDDVAAAVQAALRGFSLVVVNRAPRDVADELYEDLRRFGRLEVRSLPPPTPGGGLSADERELVELLASGVSLGEAASALHISRRTADRRLASARQALGATTTPELIARHRKRAGA
jgi:DNA-binding CsgD family transcriptional regulator